MEESDEKTKEGKREREEQTIIKSWRMMPRNELGWPALLYRFNVPNLAEL